MDAKAIGLLEDVSAWQEMLERYQSLFEDMTPGSSVGLIAREGSGVLPGKHVAALRDACAGADMLAWVAGSQGMRAERRRFAGFDSAKVDLLLVADDEALGSLGSALDGDALSTMKRLIRRGNIMFYVFRTKHQLQEAGYEDFLDSLGLAFLGACR